ncbi:MAG TPA: hypothetical protein VGL89_13330 [Candidatus Koribacter sp.]|jgi:hypothetical protein
MRNPHILALAVLLTAAMLGCHRSNSKSDEPPPDPTPLQKPAVSYQDFETAEKAFGYTNWENVEDRQPLVSDQRPPFRFTSIQARNVVDHGFNGTLVLSFYNNRLMETQFYTAHIDDYLKAAAFDERVSLDNDKSGGIPPHTHIWVGKEQDGREYLGMEDMILKNQMKDWIARYSNR